jgi:hypothetical protein
MKKILAAATFIIAIFTGCLKDNTINANKGANLNNTTTNVEIIPYSSAPFSGAGLENFGNSAISLAGTAPLTLFFVVNIAGTNGVPLSKDLTVTVGYDDAARIAYNTANPTSAQYVAMPDSDYSLPIKTGTIKAGSYLDTFYVTFYPAKIDNSKNYMAAITLMDAQGQSISGNFKTVYFHVIGNPLAGPYTTTGKRYNYTGSVTWTGPPAPYPAGYTDGTTTAYNGTVIASPLDALNVTLTIGNVPDPGVSTLATYTITANNSTYSSITYTPDAAFLTGYSNIQTYITSYTAPSATVKASFHLITKYNNTTGGAGNDRIVDQLFTHQ